MPRNRPGGSGGADHHEADRGGEAGTDCLARQDARALTRGCTRIVLNLNKKNDVLSFKIREGKALAM